MLASSPAPTRQARGQSILRTMRGCATTHRDEVQADPSARRVHDRSLYPDLPYQRAFQSATDNRRGGVVTSGRGTRTVSTPIHVG